MLLGYLQQLYALHKPSVAYDVYSTCDLLLIQKTSQLNYNKSESIFSHTLTVTVNNLPPYIRENTSISLFKTKLKIYYFAMDFTNVPDID